MVAKITSVTGTDTVQILAHRTAVGYRDAQQVTNSERLMSATGVQVHIYLLSLNIIFSGAKLRLRA